MWKKGKKLRLSRKLSSMTCFRRAGMARFAWKSGFCGTDLYIRSAKKEVPIMETAKIFKDGRGQTVQLPEKFRFTVDEVVVQQLGEAIILVPKEALWQTFIEGLNGFTDDIFDEGREDPAVKEIT
jgi:antitoxin VapB